jgi:threonine/homoserine efflux transporter RhtA
VGSGLLISLMWPVGVVAGLLGGFYYAHYRLAANVIGQQAKGTMNRAVQALKVGWR